MDKDQFYKLLRGGVMPHITIKKVLVKISEAIERISRMS